MCEVPEFVEARVHELLEHEESVRDRERERLLGPIAPEVVDEDLTGFCPGGVI